MMPGRDQPLGWWRKGVICKGQEAGDPSGRGTPARIRFRRPATEGLEPNQSAASSLVAVRTFFAFPSFLHGAGGLDLHGVSFGAADAQTLVELLG